MEFLKNFFTFVGGMLVFLIAIAFLLSPSDDPPQRIDVNSSTSGKTTEALASNETMHVGGFVCGHPATPSPNAFSARDLPAISDASSGNEARFDRDYKDRTFYDCLFFDSLERAYIGDGWNLRLKASQSSWLADATCSINDSVASRLVDVQEGQVIHVQGLIQTTAIGTVLLEGCRIHY